MLQQNFYKRSKIFEKEYKMIRKYLVCIGGLIYISMVAGCSSQSPGELKSHVVQPGFDGGGGISPPLCTENETMVNPGFDSNGCTIPQVCVDLNSCPNFAAPFCPDGVVVNLGVAQDGCLLPPVCVKKEDCPEYSPPLCLDGVIRVPTNLDESGCHQPPQCVTSKTCFN